MEVGLVVSPPGTEGVRKVMDPELCDNVPPTSRKMLTCAGRKCLESQKHACGQESAQRSEIRRVVLNILVFGTNLGNNLVRSKGSINSRPVR